MNPIPSPVSADGMVFLMSGFRGNSLKAIRLGGRQGGHHRHAGRRLDARSRHAVCAVTAALRRHPVFPEEQQRAAVGVRCEDRQAALPGAAHRRRARTCSRRRSARPGRSSCSDRREPPRCSSRARRSRCSRPTRSTINSTPRRRWSVSEMYLRGYKNLYCDGGEMNGSKSPVASQSASSNSESTLNFRRLDWQLAITFVSPCPDSPPTTPGPAPSGACRGRRSCPTP